MEPAEISAKILPFVDDPKLADRHHWTAIALCGAEETATAKQAGRRICLVLDNASWQKAKRLLWHHIEPIYLPPYIPDFNPIERIWQHLKGHGMAGQLTRSGAELGERLFEEDRLLLNDTDTIWSVSTVKLA